MHTVQERPDLSGKAAVQVRLVLSGKATPEPETMQIRRATSLVKSIGSIRESAQSYLERGLCTTYSSIPKNALGILPEFIIVITQVDIPHILCMQIKRSLQVASLTEVVFILQRRK